MLAGLWICRLSELELLTLLVEGSVKEVGLLVSLRGMLSVSVSISSSLMSSSSFSESVSMLLPEPTEQEGK